MIDRKANTFTEQAAERELDEREKKEEKVSVQLVLIDPEFSSPCVVKWRRVKAQTSRVMGRSIVVGVKILAVVVIVTLVLSLLAAREGKRMPVVVGGGSAPLPSTP